MPDDSTPAATPAVAPGSTPAPAATIPTPDPQAGDGQEQISLEEARKLRKEAQALRQRLKGFEDAEQAAKDATLSEVELTKKQLTTLQEERDSMAAELYEARVFQAVSQLASKFNFMVSSDTLARLLLLDDDAIEFEDGKPTNIEKLLDKLAKAEPSLVKTEQQQQQRGAPAVPAWNPGRSSIQQPGGNVPGRIPRLTDPGMFKTPG